MSTHGAMPGKCFAVTYSNYFPLEVDSLWATQEAAEAQAKILEGDWRVVEMDIHAAALAEKPLPDKDGSK